MNCNTCGKSENVVVMTDGKSNAPVCDKCRELVVMMWHVYLTLQKAVEEVRKVNRYTEPD